MENQELTYLWHDFVRHYYRTRPRLASLLSNTRVVNAEGGYEIRIECANEAQEEWLDEHLGDIKGLLNQASSEYSSLLQANFAYLREDGTVVKAQEKDPRPKVQQNTPSTMPSHSFKNHSREEMFQARVSREIEQRITRVVTLVNSVDTPNINLTNKAPFVMVLEEREKAFSIDPSFDYADSYLSVNKHYLEAIKEQIGSESNHYKDVSNIIVDTYLNILIKIVNNNPTIPIIKEASNRTGQLYEYDISETTKSRVLQTSVTPVELEQSKKHRKTDNYNSKGKERPSVKIRRFADSVYSVKSGNTRYTTPLLGWIALPIYLVGWIVSLFDRTE